MSKEIEEIMCGIRNCFSDFNGKVAKEDNDEYSKKIKLDIFVNEINQKLRVRESVPEVNEVNMVNKMNKSFTSYDDNNYSTNYDDNNYSTIKIILPEIEIPEFKMSICNKNVSIEESKIEDLCKKIKLGLKMRYFVDDDDITYFDIEGENWNRVSLKDPLKCVEDASKVIDKGVKETGKIIKKSFDNVKCEVDDISKNVDKYVKNSSKKMSSKTQVTLKADAEALNSKLQAAYEELLKKLEGYKKQMDDLGDKLKESTKQIKVQKDLLNNVDNNLKSSLQVALKNLEIPIPCVVIRKNVMKIGIEIRYPSSYDNIINNIYYIIDKIVKGEMMNVILENIMNIVAGIKENASNVIDDVLNVAIDSFKDSVQNIIKLIGEANVNVSDFKCEKINKCTQGDWVQAKFNLPRTMDIIKEN